MAGGRRFRPSPAMVVASLALLVALGGTGIAAVTSTAPPNSVNTAAIKTGAVTNAKLHADAVTSSKVKNGSLLKIDFASGQLPAGPPGPPGAAGAPGAKGDKGDVGDASLVAFANVNGTGAQPSIRSFGGHGTTGASVLACGTG